MKALSPQEMTPAQRELFQQERGLARQVLQEVSTATEIGTLPLFVASRIDPHVKERSWQLGVACAKGCAWCCHGFKVELTPPEAIAIAEYLRSKSDPERLPAIGDALSDEADEARSLSVMDRWVARRPCHFLDQASGSCSIWEARPLGCRSLTSLDASACKSAYEGEGDRPGVPRPISVETLYGLSRGAMHAACEDEGLDMRAFELTNAVAVAFHVPRAAERWHAGERVFDHAVIPSDESDRALFNRDRQDVIPDAQLLPKNRERAANEKKRARRAQRER